MPQEKIIIKFSAKGDRALIGAIKQLDIATKRLQDKTSLYEKELKKLGLQQTKVNNGTVLGTRNNRLLANSFATLRSKLLLVSFAATMAAKPLFQLVKAQSDAEEIANKFNVVFGNQTDIVREWANALGTSVGRAGSELEFMLSTLQDTFVPLGFSREAATQLSTSLTQLALDVASFNNKADSDVIRDFQSALVGNHETVRKYGIVMTEASLQAEAFNSGIIGTKRELTASEKVQARLNILYEGSKDAIGDLDRTQDSFANTLKRFNAEVLIARQELGLELMPVARDLLVIMSGLVSHFKDTAVLKGYATALGAVGIAMSAARIHALGFAASITTLKVAAAKTGIALLFIGVGELAARMLYAKDQTAGLNKEFDDLDEKLKQLLKGEGGVDNLSSAELDLIEIEKQLAEIYKKRAKLTEDVEKAQKALNDEIARQEEKRLTERIKELEDAIKDLNDAGKTEIDIFKEKISGYQELNNAVANSGRLYQTIVQQNMAADLAATKQTSEYKRAMRRGDNDAMEKMEKEAKNKHHSNLVAAFRMEQASSIVNIIMSFAQAHAKTFAQLGIIGGLASMPVLSALTALQVGLVAAQAPPAKFARGGMIGGRRHSQGGTMIEAEAGEFVMSRNAVDSVGIENLNRMNQGGGSSSVTVNVSGNVMSQDYVEGELAEQIKEAIRRGNDFGQA